jgi:hypothetical protein
MPMKISGCAPVHFLFNMDFKRVLVTYYYYPKPSVNYAVFYVKAYKQIFWLEKLMPAVSYELQREHQRFRHQR